MIAKNYSVHKIALYDVVFIIFFQYSIHTNILSFRSFQRQKSKNSESEDLFNFTNKPPTNILDDTDKPFGEIYVKQEKSSPPLNKNQSNDVTNETSTDSIMPCSNSSVFAIPNQTDEIIFLEDSESFFNPLDNLLDSKNDDSDSKHQEMVTQARMEYGSPVRRKKDKAAMPGFECAECAPVCKCSLCKTSLLYFIEITVEFLTFVLFQWYRFIGASLTNKEIQERINKCSRHKRNVNLNATPDGFWLPYFLPTQEGERDDTNIDYRFVNRNT